MVNSENKAQAYSVAEDIWPLVGKGWGGEKEGKKKQGSLANGHYSNSKIGRGPAFVK